MDRLNGPLELAKEMEHVAIRLQHALNGNRSNNAVTQHQNVSMNDRFPHNRLAEQELHFRVAREVEFASALFGEPAWNILLDLYVEASTNRKVSVSSACLAARVPATTALRWISILEREELVVRNQDPRDCRRTFVELTPDACSKMQRYLASVS